MLEASRRKARPVVILMTDGRVLSHRETTKKADLLKKDGVSTLIITAMEDPELGTRC